MKKHLFFSIMLFMAIAVKAQINIDLKAYLEGPFFGTEMTPWLNAFGKLPMNQPYGVSPWYYFGNESVASMPNANVVDWVLVEIRQSTGDAASAKLDSIVSRKAVFLLKNGLIRGLDGTSLITMNLQVYANLYAVVYHRNHITTMSAMPLILDGGVYGYDFTTGPTVVFGGTTGHKQIGTNIWGQISGDGNSDGNITQLDKISVWKPQSGQSGYLNGDFNMNSQVDNTDKSSYWRPNSGRSTQVPSFGGLNTPPTAILNINPVIGSTITVFTLDATNSYDAQTLSSLLAARWDFENDGTWDTPYSYNKTITHQYPVSGDYTFKVEVIDIGGLTDTETYTVNVAQSYGVSCPGIPTVTYEGQVYNTVQIGTQCWLKENLNVGTIVNGNQDQADNQVIEKYCYNNVSANCAIYGGMYQWDELMQYTNLPGSKGICPTGWHVPRLEEWNTLVEFLGGITVAGGKMKETGLLRWNPPNTGATNESGYTAFPGGSRPVSGYFTDLGNAANFWSSTEGYSTYAWLLTLLTYDAGVLSSYTPQTGAISARCILDPPQPVWSCGDTMVDARNGQTYNTVQIGTQCWMQENLNIGTMVDGSQNQQDNQIIEKYCYNNNTANCDEYGGLYQWNEMMQYMTTPGSKGICPNDWHVPTDDEFCTLTQFIDPTVNCGISDWNGTDVGTRMKSTAGWSDGGNGTNTSGFNAIPGGYRFTDGNFEYITTDAHFWTSIENGSNAWYRHLDSYHANIYRNNRDKIHGYSVRCIKDSIPASWTCGQPLSVIHVVGDVAPVNKTVNYGTVETNLTGSNKCWITQNLGSDHQAVSATDATEESAGWYWQFNRKQGYKHDGTTRTPNTTWISSINENSDWLPDNDPCTLLLGAGWRLPTSTELTNADANGGWSNYYQTYGSVLKLHSAGYLSSGNGYLNNRGSSGNYWSSIQYNSMQGKGLIFSSDNSSMGGFIKIIGISGRCLSDEVPISWSCGQPLSVTHTTGDIAPVDKTVDYGTVETNLTGSNKCWITQNLGSDHQAVSATDNTEESAGWYWQFNRKQGYKHDGTIRTPNTTWITSINENSDWLLANDPCALLLGNEWRLPTVSEWNNADLNGGWNNLNDTYVSVLKLHSAGYLEYNNGNINGRGIYGRYWSNTQHSNSLGFSFGFSNSGSLILIDDKANGFSIRCLKDFQTNWSCGQPLPVFHGAGEVAPVNKAVNYGTVETNLSGDNKCWITQNLGADHQAVSATDATEESAGWYWQFNRKQGYKHDGTTRTPNTIWISSINEISDWLLDNDPCTLLLGIGWRLPTNTEWTNADANGGWNNYNQTYGSLLKIHAGGYLSYSTGILLYRGSAGYYWSSTQDANTLGWGLSFASGACAMTSYVKPNGFSSRCLKDLTPPSWSCGQPLSVTHTTGNIAPVNKTVNYGTVETNLTGSNKCWITQNLGSDHQAVSATDATEASAGWYWQFNKKQGYKHDGTIRTPNTAWISEINENSNWLPTNDPCTLLLGAGWRLPTSTEWTNADDNGSWNNREDAYASILKLHAAGFINWIDGSLAHSGISGFYWSSTQYSSVLGWTLSFTNDNCYIFNSSTKSYGDSCRCIKD